MKKVIYTYGLIAGTIIALLMFATIPMWNGNVFTAEYGMLVGYTTMVISLSMIFFGVKSFRDNHSNGTITFGKGLKIGLGISLIAVIMYALAWEINFQFVFPNFTEQMLDHNRQQLEASGVSGAELQKELEGMEDFARWYQNPLLRFGITITEVLPVGILISLISAALLRKKEFLPASETIEATNESTNYSKS